MRLSFLVFLLMVLSVPAIAADDAETSPEASQKEQKIDPPIITFAQKVEIVVPIQKNPLVLSATVDQNEYAITLSLTVQNGLKLDEAKKIGTDFLIRTKDITLDDPAEKDEPGKGLYDYTILIIRANGKTVVEGIKKADESKIDWSK